jgi:GxxExxY protein
MNADEHRLLTEKVLGAAFEVSNTLGSGFLEKVYARALLAEIRSRGIAAEPEVPFSVRYKGQLVGEYYADLVIEGSLAVELKCADRLANEHLAQCLNYLRASGLELCLLLNFQRSKLEWKRVVLTQRL